MQTKIKILQLIKGLGAGGAERLLSQSLDSFDHEQFEIVIAYLMRHKDALVPEIEAGGHRTVCLNQRFPGDPTALIRFNAVLAEYQPDILHMHLPYAGLLGKAAARLSRTRTPRLVYTEHNVIERYHPITRKAHRMMFGGNDAVVAVSQDVANSIRGHIPSRAIHRLSTVPNGIPFAKISEAISQRDSIRAEFQLPQSASVVVNVANFTPKKRHVDLLSAIQIMVSKNPNVHALLVGTGPLLAEMKRVAESLEITDHVHFLGYREDAPAIIASGDVFVMSSLFEGLPLSILEAMATRTPIVSTEVGGIPEVLTHGETAILVPPQAPRALAEETLQLLASPELSRQLVQKAYSHGVSNYDISKNVELLSHLYRELLSAK